MIVRGAGPEDAPGSTRFCLIGIDGLRIDDALDGGSPFLSELAAAGTFARMTMEVPTLSGPGWTSLLTATPHHAHRVLDNRFLGHVIVPRSDLLSRAALARPGTVTFAAASWPPLVDPAGPGPVIAWRSEDQRAGRHRVVALDGETQGYRSSDAELSVAASTALGGGGVDAAFVYLGEVDEAGHRHGGTSLQYQQAVRRVDDHLEALSTTIATRADRAGEDWVVAVTTDHGHLDAGGHGGAEDVVRRSFVAARRFGPDQERDLDLSDTIEPWDVTPWLLGLRAG